VKSNPNAAIPPGPPTSGSPLALATDVRPELPRLPQDTGVAPARVPEPAAIGDGVLPAGGVPPDDSALPPIRRRKADPQPGQLPSPYGPKGEAKSPVAPKQDVRPQPADAPAAPSAAAKNLAEIKKVVQVSTERWAKVDTYETIITRKEATPKGEINNEVVLFQYRKEPMSVFTRNIGEVGKGREVVYNPGKYGDKLHLMIGEGDSPVALIKAGYKPAPMSPDDPRVRDKSRYSIREAGFGTPIGKMAKGVALYEAGKFPADALTYLGPVTRPEFKKQHVGIQMKLRPGDDPSMPTGGVRQILIDMDPESQSYGMPVLILADDDKGKTVEYYLFEKIRMPAGLTEADFSPDRLGKKR
jgi:hypothetical protein